MEKGSLPFVLTVFYNSKLFVTVIAFDEYVLKWILTHRLTNIFLYLHILIMK